MPDFDWIVDRNLALTVLCPYCHAPIGEPCVTVKVGDGTNLLEHFPAHTVRVRTARHHAEEAKS